MTIQESIEEAEMLRVILRNFAEKTYTMPKFKESEVSLRAETLRGFILILQNDVFEMLNEWKKEHNEIKGGGK